MRSLMYSLPLCFSLMLIPGVANAFDFPAGATCSPDTRSTWDKAGDSFKKGLGKAWDTLNGDADERSWERDENDRSNAVTGGRG